MLKRLVEFLKNNHPNSNIDDYLDAKYIRLNDPQLKQIAKALHSGELQIKPASSCQAERFIFHFGNTIILLKKDKTNSAASYQAELSWETDFLAIHSTRSKGKGFYFIGFEFDDDYQVTLTETDKRLDNQVHNQAQNQALIDKTMPILRGFILAISQE